MEQIYITEVAPRDGLQNQSQFVTTADKVELISRLAEAGIHSIEATSFVSPKAVPQMADAAEVLAGISAIPALDVSVLVPNLKGLQRALSAGAREVAVVLSATDSMNRSNINMSLDDALSVCEDTLKAARGAGISARAYIAVAFECPFEGKVNRGRVIELAERMALGGAREVVIADTIGAAGPSEVQSLLRDLRQTLPVGQTGVHFHDTRGLASANAWAALEAGIRRFDSSLGGIGGCPFAPGAAGNLATEDLVLLAHQSGLSTGISLDALLDPLEFAEKLLKRPLGGRCMAWYRRTERKPATTAVGQAGARV